MNLTTLSTEQLNLYLHETKWLLEQLGKVIPKPETQYPEVYQQSSHTEAQVDALREALLVERARRQLIYLQALLVVKDTTHES